MVSAALLSASRWGAVVGPIFLVLVALSADQMMTPLDREFMTPLDEGMVMDMPITVPRASVSESLDDLKARDMVLCRFPEVDMVVGKAGRADTPTDPAPMDMIETMVNFRPREFWPRRKLHATDATEQGRAVLDALVDRRVVGPPGDATARESLIEQSVAEALVRFDAASREYAYHRYQERVRESAGLVPSSINPSDPAEARLVPLWRRHVAQVDDELVTRAAPIFTRLVMDQFLERATILDPSVAAHVVAASRIALGVDRGGARGHGEPTARRFTAPSLRELRFKAAPGAPTVSGCDPGKSLPIIRPVAPPLAGRS